MPNKNSKSKIKANNKWVAKNYDRVNLALPKGTKDTIKVIAKQRGLSINGYITCAINKQLQADGAEGFGISNTNNLNK